MKKVFLYIFLFISNFSIAQVKIGSNPTTITTNKNFEVEAANGKKINLNKDDGRMYLENTPTASLTDSLVLKYTDGEIRQMSVSKFLKYVFDTQDLDNDGILNGTDPDIDGDGILNGADNCPMQFGCSGSPNGCPGACNFTSKPDSSSNGTAKITAFTNCTTATAGTLTQGTAVSGVTQTITVTVATAGTYNISATANGVTFAGSGSLATGTQTIILTASGTPTSTGSNSFTLNTTPNCSFSRTTVSGNSATSNGTAVISSFDNCSTATAGTLTQGTAVSGVTQTITVTVATAGTYSISATSNGVTFSGTGTLAIGTQSVVLTATGTPTSAGTHTFTLNTTPNCGFSRTTISPLPANISLTLGQVRYIASVYDANYMSYSSPTSPATLSTGVNPDATAETTINVQGTLSTTGVTISIPYTVTGSPVSLPAFSQQVTVPASYTEDGVSRVVQLDYAAANLSVGSGYITATIKSVGGVLNAKKLDLNAGLGNDYKGWLLAEFDLASNSSGSTGKVQLRDIPGIPDRNISDGSHTYLYLPVTSSTGKIWLNNDLGAAYNNFTSSSFNPTQQATSVNDVKAYGNKLQWGRNPSDKHDVMSWTSVSPLIAAFTSTTSTLASSDTPNHNQFIAIGASPVDWRTPQNDNLWQGVNGVNNPCPYGFRLPRTDEWIAEKNTFPSSDVNGAYASPLKLVPSGMRDAQNGSIANLSQAWYWASTPGTWLPDGFKIAQSMLIDTAWIQADHASYRAYALSVRCIQD